MWERRDSPFIYFHDYTTLTRFCFLSLLFSLLQFQFKRRPLYYLFNLVIPTMFLSLVAMLTFFLPPESGEKISLGITVLLSLTVFLLLVAETMPPTNTVPVIGECQMPTLWLVL